ncbi:hypothetical protein M3231_02505 [Neobacillus mesonae]|nr:hypothetical protein [Neobacillus mesonae]
MNQTPEKKSWGIPVIVVCTLLLLAASYVSFEQYRDKQEELSSLKSSKAELWDVNKKLWNEAKEAWIDVPIKELTALQVLLSQDTVKMADLQLRINEIANSIGRANELFSLMEPYFNARGGEGVSTNELIQMNEEYSDYIREDLLPKSSALELKKGSEEHENLLDHIELLLQDYEFYKYSVYDLHINEDGPNKIQTAFIHAVNWMIGANGREDHSLYKSLRSSWEY